MNTHLIISVPLAIGAALALSFDAPPPPSGPSATAGNPSSVPASYAVDAVHSTVMFRTKHLGVSYAYGRFNAFSGKVEYDPENLAGSSISLEIEAESVDTNSPDRDTHLRSPDFFSAKEFPAIAFESTQVSGTAEALEITGELTLHGETREVVAKGQLVGTGDSPMGDHRAGFEATFTVDMREFGFSFVKQNEGAIGPEADVTVSLECIRQ